MFNSKVAKDSYCKDKYDVVKKVRDEFDNKLNILSERINHDLIKILKRKEIYINIFLDKNYDKSNLNKILIDYDYDNDIGYIGEVFIKLDYFERREIEERKFKGRIVLNEMIYDFIFILEKDIRYIKEYEKLVNLANKNNLIFNNFPKYIFDRMYRLKVMNLDERITLNDIFLAEEIIYDFEELDHNIEKNVSLFWNLSKINIFPEFKIYPSENYIFYEYYFNITDNYIYLVDEDEKDIYGIVLSENNLKIYSKKLDKKIWELYKVEKLKEYKGYTNFNKFFEIPDIFNKFNLNRIIESFDIFNNSFYVKDISNERGRYISFEEDDDNREIVYLKIRIINKKDIYDKLKYFKDMLENKYINDRVRVIIDEN